MSSSSLFRNVLTRSRRIVPHNVHRSAHTSPHRSAHHVPYASSASASASASTSASASASTPLLSSSSRRPTLATLCVGFRRYSSQLQLSSGEDNKTDDEVAEALQNEETAIIGAAGTPSDVNYFEGFYSLANPNYKYINEITEDHDLVVWFSNAELRPMSSLAIILSIFLIPVGTYVLTRLFTRDFSEDRLPYEETLPWSDTYVKVDSQAKPRTLVFC